MKNNLQPLFENIEAARKNFIHSLEGLSPAQVNFKPSEKEWSVLEITEHMVWAEQIGVCGMFKAIEGLKNKQPIWEGTSPNKGLKIEEIIGKTWQPKEKVPDVAKPRWGGSIYFWISSLKNCGNILRELYAFSENIKLEKAIYPHPISGPMNVVQRLEFLRFHLDRHAEQLKRVKSHIDFPKAN